MPDESVFGDDTNATPLSKLNVPQMSSNKGQPLEAPVYSPDIPQPEQKTVRFADPPSQQQQQPPPQQQQMERLPPRSPHPPAPPPAYYDRYYGRPRHRPPLPPEEKRSKFGALVDTYAHRIIVFAVVCLALYWYGALIQLPYIGNQASTHMTVFGITVVGLLGASMYGVGEYLID